MRRSRRSESGGKSRAPGGPAVIGPRLLAEWPLPQPAEDDDKEARGRVLVVGGSGEMPGAVILAAVAALRAGAGKLRMAVPAGIAPWVGAAVPEGRVFALPETDSGALALDAAQALAEYGAAVRCVLIGPGMVDEEATAALVRDTLPGLRGRTVVLDAAGLACLGAGAEILHALEGNAVITPHAGEMASCLRAERSEVAGDPVATARLAAERFRCVVALKGAETVIAAPDGRVFVNRAGNVGLATSGSGDTLAGIVAGLAARGADPLQAAAWGVHLHARAGDRLAKKVGPLGFLARELLAEIPGLMVKLGRVSG